MWWMTPPTQIDMRLAHALRSMRERAGLSQEALAHKAGITVTALGRVERGRVNPGWTTLRSILTGLDASLTDLEAAIKHAKA